MEDATRAYADYRTAIKVSPTTAVRATVYSDLAGAYQGQGDYASALAAVRRAIQLLPNTAHFYVTAGDIQRDAGDYTQALGSYDHALRLVSKGPDAEKAHEGKGDVFARQGRQALAIAQYRAALKLVAASDTTTKSRVQGKITSVQSGQSQ